ncbi:hypothetical protein KDE37_24170, partial [Pseudomonas aeruginosa]|uniref:hypothetical protein n=2 Tax=Pseudomonas aeruginosa TaxID=287 RepID=UPI001B819147
WISGLGILLSENQGRLPRESAMNQKKDHLRGEGDGLQRSVGDLGFSRRRYDLTPLRWGKMLWADSGYRCR